MQYYENFSEFRRLVVALDAVLLELCGAVDLMRHRFLRKQPSLVRSGAALDFVFQGDPPAVGEA